MASGDWLDSILLQSCLDKMLSRCINTHKLLVECFCVGVLTSEYKGLAAASGYRQEGLDCCGYTSNSSYEGPICPLLCPFQQ